MNLNVGLSPWLEAAGWSEEAPLLMEYSAWQYLRRELPNEEFPKLLVRFLWDVGEIIHGMDRVPSKMYVELRYGASNVPLLLRSSNEGLLILLDLER